MLVCVTQVAVDTYALRLRVSPGLLVGPAHIRRRQMFPRRSVSPFCFGTDTWGSGRAWVVWSNSEVASCPPSYTAY